jgi:16S rRNA (guanine527-N7)-methyltransferase
MSDEAAGEQGVPDRSRTDRFEELRAVLEDARSAGFLGPGPVEAHLEHAAGFAVAAEGALGREPANFVDLGTGGGVPGLWLGLRWDAARGILVESGHRRCVGLRAGLARLGLDGRIAVVEDRAETAGAPGIYRESFEVVTARSFAVPAVTAEIAAGLVQVGGVLIVSEPPERSAARWPSSGLADLGFRAAEYVQTGSGHFVVAAKLAPTPARYPRASGRPGKRPLW